MIEETALIKAIRTYQCPGCVCGHKPSTCASLKKEDGYGCKNHCAGTIIEKIGKIFLGMPKGFNRLGPYNSMKLYIFKDWESFLKIHNRYDEFNIPFWKYIDDKGNLMVRGFMPRINEPFIHIILNCTIEKVESISCKLLTYTDIDRMD